MTARLCLQCESCEDCGDVAYCLDDTQPPPCPHDRGLCGNCNLTSCPDCQIDAAGDLLPPPIPRDNALKAQAAHLASIDHGLNEQRRTYREAQAVYIAWANTRNERNTDG